MTYPPVVKKWVRGSPSHFGGDVIEGKWHYPSKWDDRELHTVCGKKTMSFLLGFDSRKTDPKVAERCKTCTGGLATTDDLARLHREQAHQRPERARWKRRHRMSKVDLGAAREAAEKEGLITSGGAYFKLKDGDNRIRLLAGPLEHPGSYNGKPNFKWLWHILDRADGTVKPMFMSPVIYDMLGDLQKDPDFEFDEVPMPFDVNIKTTNAGTLKARYSVIPSPRRIPLTKQEMDLLAAATPLVELRRILREKAGDDRDQPSSNGNGEAAKSFDPDEIPF